MTEERGKERLQRELAEMGRQLEEANRRIAELERLEAQREQVEEALRIKDWAIASFVTGIAFANLEGNLTYANDAFLRLWGYNSLEEILDRPAVGFWWKPEEATEVVEALHTDGRWTGELTARKKDGSPFDVQLLASMITDVEDRPIGMLASFRDITQRKRAEEALQESEERFRRAFFEAPFPIMIHAEGGEVIRINKVWMELTGYSHDEIPTTADWTERAYGERKEGVKEGIDRLYDLAERVREGEYVITTRAGEERTWEFSSAPLGRLPDGRRLVISMAMDVTERKRAEETLLERERFLALLNDITRAALETTDLPTMLQTLTDRLAELIDADGCYITLWGEETETPVPPGDRRKVYSTLQGELGERSMIGALLQAGHTVVIEDVLDTPYISQPVARLFPDRSLLGLPLVAGDQRLGAALITFDEPHRFTPEEIARGEQAARPAALAVAKALLVESLRQHTVELEKQNEELAAFAYTVAHDLKNPLSRTIGFAEVLETDYATRSEEELGRYLHLIAQNGRKMSRIIDELLLLSRLRQAEVEMTPLDMGSIVAEAQQRLADVIQEYQAEITLPQDWPTALGYGPWVEEVWVNYLSNSIKYGGQPPQVALGAEVEPDGRVRFWIRDNGAGLTPEEQNLLFIPFTRLDQARARGHGLGLSVVRRIVEKLGGEVGVESEVGRGSTFYFILPGLPQRSEAA